MLRLDFEWHVLQWQTTKNDESKITITLAKVMIWDDVANKLVEETNEEY